jgi:hypothetical protein
LNPGSQDNSLSHLASHNGATLPPMLSHHTSHIEPPRLPNWATMPPILYVTSGDT